MQVELPQLYPAAGWVEQDPLAIWETVQAAIKDCMARAAAAHGSVTIKALGITNQS
jgi:glycerol kinase